MKILRFGAKGEAVITLQTQLKKLGFTGKNRKALIIDGDFGEQTEYAVMQFQRKHNLLDDGKVGEKTYAALHGKSTDKLLSAKDYANAAKRLDVSELVIRVFGAVEGLGAGFLPNGKPKILFERHRMYYYLKQQHGTAFANQMQAKYPNIVNRATGGYQGNNAEHVRLATAMQIDRDCALMSASWGQFQIMGENWKSLGYASVQDFVDSQYLNEANQLDAFVRFIEFKKGEVDGKDITLIDALRQQNWHAVFTLYNGRNYKKLGYQAKFQREWDHLEPLYGKQAA